MTDPYHIRLACRKDIAKLQEIEVAAATRFVGLGLIDHLLKDSFNQDKLVDLIEKQQAWVICQVEMPVGFALVSIVGNSAYLEEMDVLPEHGNRGLGARLLATVCNWAREQFVNAVLLSTFKSVPWNAPFYAKHGFEILSEDQWSPELIEIRSRELDSGLPVEKRVFMRLKLQGSS